MPWFTTWFDTAYYKMLYGHRDAAEARAWVHALLEKLSLSPSSEVLDIACGRGRHARLFANAGMRVTGIDLSEECVREARSISDQVEYHVHDMRMPFARDRFDLAVCLFTSLGYSSDRNDDQLTLIAAAAAIKPGGRFVLDLMNTERICRELVPNEGLEVDGVKFEIRRALENGNIVKHIRIDDHGSEHRFTERVHAFTIDGVTAMVERAGLRIFDLTDGPVLTPFDPLTSERLVIWAERSR